MCYFRFWWIQQWSICIRKCVILELLVVSRKLAIAWPIFLVLRRIDTVKTRNWFKSRNDIVTIRWYF